MQRDKVPGTNYIIVQDENNFKYTSDSLILSSFVKMGQRALDLGCGNGIISLRIVDRFKELYAIDYNIESLELFKIALKENYLEGKIRLIQDDILNLGNYFPNNYFDQILFNPPYFNCFEPKSNMEKARHSTDIRNFIEIVSKLLKSRGDFTIIFPSNRISELIYYLNLYKLKVKDMIAVKPNLEKPALHFILRCRKDAKFGNFYREFIVHESDYYSEQMLKVYNNEVLLWYIFAQHPLAI